MRLSKLIPWDELEEEYAGLFSDKMGAPAKAFRMALGALLIKERLTITDEETVEQIRETPYLQYLVGLSEYTDESPFNPSMMEHFRKRITPEILARINDIIVNRELPKEDGDHNNGDLSRPEDDCSDSTDRNPNAGIMMVDASVAPADIAYPTDLNLLNESREKLEEIIDVLYEPVKGKIEKPRTYRMKARKAYLKVAKQRKTSHQVIRKAIKRQLQYISRDLKHIEALKALTGLGKLSSQQYRKLLVIHFLFRYILTLKWKFIGKFQTA